MPEQILDNFKLSGDLFKQVRNMQAPPPTSLLGYHRILSPSAAVRVSPLCLGAMNFGEAWKAFMGECTKETAFEMLDYFYEQGGNFIDTANAYQNDESEEWIGEWMEARGVRDQMVIATKVSLLCVYISAGSGLIVNSIPLAIEVMYQESRATILAITQSRCLLALTQA